LKKKGFKEERVTKVGLDAIGTSTTLESNKSVRLNTQIASIDANMQIGKPIQIGREFLLQHAVIRIMPAKGAPKKEDELVRESHDGVLQRMSFFLPL
jgi:argininosuccinate synthase